MNKMNQRYQNGFVSIIVTMILLVVTSLLVISFAFLARQNQTRNLNQQLSTQAFYAAESGVNDAVAKLQAGKLTDNSDCAGTASTLGEASLNVSYTCVLVNQSPTNLQYDSVGSDQSVVVHVKTAVAGTLRISWQSKSGDTIFAPTANNNFYLPQAAVANTPSAATSFGLDQGIAAFPNHTGLVRATIIPTAAATSTTSLMAASRTFFLYPLANGAASQAGSGSADGTFISGNCNTNNNSGTFPKFCNADISGAPTDFYLRLKGIYQPSAVEVQVLSGGAAQSITGAQAVIDATGKAQNVERRIQVRLPLTKNYLYPEFAVETADTICKRFSAWPGGASVIKPNNKLYSLPNPFISNSANDDAKACQLPGQWPPRFP